MFLVNKLLICLSINSFGFLLAVPLIGWEKTLLFRLEMYLSGDDDIIFISLNLKRVLIGDSVIEPCTYGAGGNSSATFYRANSKKGQMANLNTPSTIFMTPSDIESKEGGSKITSLRNSWHALVAELAMLAMATELAELS